jgi:hypothetical protein
MAARLRRAGSEICTRTFAATLVVRILSEGQKQLARRAAMLSAECERLEAFAVRDERPGPINWKDEAAFKSISILTAFCATAWAGFLTGLV